ncbi:odorant receptor 4 [Aethina tumida]|uniref:odorant receptor 4 n=1 Tax=Aethina tumida TaxID=116153 RepID=UPI002147F18E|nr:odorant receptor 4 [Aethina tumida]
MDCENLVLLGTLRSLKLLGVFLGNPGKDSHLLLKYILMTPLFYISHVTLFYDLVYRIKNGIPLDVELCATMCSALVANYMLIVFLFNIDSVMSICHHLSSTEEFPLPPDFIPTRDRVEKFAHIYRIYICVSSVIYSSSKAILTNPCQITKAALNVERDCALYLPTFFPFKIEYFPVYQLVFLVQGCSLLHILIGASYVALLSYEIISYLGNRMNHLCLILETISTEKDEKLQKETIKFCVRYHEFIIRISTDTSSLYNKIFAIHAIAAALVFAGLSKQALNDLNAALHLIGWIGCIFLVCHTGQNLIHVSENLGEKIMFMCKWYKLNSSLQKDLQLILLRSQRPLTLPAGPFATLNYELFIKVIKTAYSYFTFIANT